MDRESYKIMKVGSIYNAYYVLGGKYLIRKLPSGIDNGLVEIITPTPSLNRVTHFSLFTLLGEVKPTTQLS